MKLMETLLNLETEFGDVWISKELGRQITIALSAGEMTRGMCDEEVAGIMRGMGFHMCADNIIEAAEAWDIATGESV